MHCWRAGECTHKIRSTYNITVCTVPVTNIYIEKSPIQITRRARQLLGECNAKREYSNILHEMRNIDTCAVVVRINILKNRPFKPLGGLTMLTNYHTSLCLLKVPYPLGSSPHN